MITQDPIPIASPITVASEVLRGLCVDLLIGAQLEAEDARLVADSLVEANLRGIDSHGVARLPHYLRRLARRSIEPRPVMNFVRLGPAVGRVDGNHGLGQLVMQRATREAIVLAGQAGAGWVSVCESSHCGALDYFGLQIARAGMIGFVFTHVDPMVLPFGATQPFCGTNPLCLTAPGQDGQTFCLDMATSVVPWNLIADAALAGEPIPLGWAVDALGRDTTDASAVNALYPTGQYKGSGLGLAIEILCSMLSGAPYGPDVPKMYGDLSQRRHLGGLVGAIDIARFLPLAHVQGRLTELLTRWGDLPALARHGRVLYPGQAEEQSKEQRLREGIPLPAPLVAELEELAAAHGLGAWLVGSVSAR